MKIANTAQTGIDEKASLDLTTYAGQRFLARQMRLADLLSQSGKRLPGAEALINRIYAKALQKGITIKKMISPEHLRRFLPKDLEGDEVRYVDLDTQRPFLRSYLLRLASVKTIFNLEGQLTETEAEAALRVYYEFSDPYGETVDLIPQLAIVHEIAERKANSRPIHDIDDYFAYAPWRSGANKDLYSFALNQGKAIPPQLRLVCPFIPTEEPPTILTDKPKPRAFDINLVLVGAHAHLGMPYALNYSTLFGSGENPKETRYKIMAWDSPMLNINSSPEGSKHLCGWQVQLEAAMTGKLTPAVQVTNYRNTLPQDDLQDDIDRLDKRIADAKSESEASND